MRRKLQKLKYRGVFWSKGKFGTVKAYLQQSCTFYKYEKMSLSVTCSSYKDNVFLDKKLYSLFKRSPPDSLTDSSLLRAR